MQNDRKSAMSSDVGHDQFTPCSPTRTQRGYFAALMTFPGRVLSYRCHCINEIYDRMLLATFRRAHNGGIAVRRNTTRPFFRRLRSTVRAFPVRPIVLILVVVMIATMTDLLPT